MPSRMIRKLLQYDAETGVFTWLVQTSIRVKAGHVAGSLKSDGYLQIKVDRKNHLAHRLAWFYMHGNWPEGQIDHRDGNRANNRISNLRDVSNSVNQQNQLRARLDNKCGLLGVCASLSKWQAMISIDGKKRYLGTFDTPEQAHAAYIAAKRELHEGCTI